MMDMDVFCVQPFRQLIIERRQTGLCCWVNMHTWQGPSEQLSIQEAWNSPRAQRIRKSIHDGSFRYCKDNCPFLHPAKIKEVRDNLRNGKPIIGPITLKSAVVDPQLKSVINETQTVLPYLPPAVNCGFDRSCNLSCPSCRTRKIIETDKADEILSIQKTIEDEAFPGVEALHITGSGDPFGSPYFNRWLRYMDISKLPKLKEIYLHTNAQLWTQKMWNLIPADVQKLCRVAEISIDAASAETYAINRRGGSFSRLLENLAFISLLRKNGPLVDLKFSMVVQQNNFHEMADFVKLGKEYNADTVFFTALSDWNTFSPDGLRRRQIHMPDHPEHEVLVQILQDDIFKDPCVELGNLKQYAKH